MYNMNYRIERPLSILDILFLLVALPFGSYISTHRTMGNKTKGNPFNTSDSWSDI